MIALSIAWNAPTKVRSSVRPSPGMIVWAYRPKIPTMMPIVRVAAIKEMARNVFIADLLQKVVLEVK
jgi:Na+/H+-translocating membrane pyrophosphatase